jgi:protein involved in polysaccharide export with SLBB domain
MGKDFLSPKKRMPLPPAFALSLIAALFVFAPLTPVRAQQAVNLSDLFKGAAGAQGAGTANSPNPATANQQRQPLPSLANFPQRKKSVCQFVPMDERGNPLRPPYLVEGATRVPANPAGRTSQGFGSGLEDSLQQDQQKNAQAIQVFEELFYYPNAFERYVKTVTGKELCRFGHQLTYDMSPFFEPPPLAMVPDTYLLGPGDEVFIRIWGSVERDLAAVIDRSGLVVIPQVGPVKLGGLAFGQAERTVRRAVSRLYSDFNTSLSLGQLRNIQVFVTGYAEKPGAYNVGNLSSLSSVLLAAGGPSTSGSFRNIQLRRGNSVVTEIDFYELILKGSKQSDRILLNGDVIHVGSIGPQVAVLGGVNHPAVFEVKPSETLNTLIDMAGGLVPGADTQSVHLLPIAARSQGFQAVNLKGSEPRFMQDGDVVVARNDTGLSLPSDKKVKQVTVQGQVRKPGQYFMPASATLADAIEQAGGTKKGADADELFVIRANGEARSLSRGSSVLGFQLTASDSQQLQVYPGDTVVVPENMNKTTVFRELRDYATLIYQLGLGVAAFKVLRE